MNSLSPLMLIYLDASYADDALPLSAALGFPESHVVTGGFTQATAAMSARQASPSYMVIDIGNAGPEVLTELDQFSQYCEPDLRVVVVGGINDVSFYRELKQRGVVEYFTRPLPYADVRQVLVQQAFSAYNASSEDGVVLCFMSAASGDGSSTVALNTAYTLANDMKASTVLVDMDYQFGMIAKNLDLNCPFGIRELFEHPDRGVDITLIKRMMVPYGDNLKIIAAPNELRLLTIIRPEIVRDMIMILRSQFKFVVMDIPHIWSGWTAAAVSNSTHNILVSQLWLRSVTHATRLLTAWRDIGVDKQAISLVINRSGAKFKEAITASDFEKVSNKKIDFYLANDIKTIVNAENQGKTLVEVGPSLLERQIRELTQSLVMRYSSEAVKAEAERLSASAQTQQVASSRRGGLLSIFDKKS